MPGWKVFTVGDDICWMQPGPDGRLWAINPESGYFGVAPGTSPKTNKNAYDTIRKDTLFTNVALTADNEPWWEGIGKGQPAIDWQGRPYDPKNGPAAHPNSRFTVSAHYNPSYTKEAENPKGVPISAIIFGGRRRELAPLIYQARSWQHGVLVGAAVASETTAAATGAVGIVRRDSMAMKPFAGYNFGDYFQHWLNIGAKLKNPPKLFHVNWFRQGADGKFLWPGLRRQPASHRLGAGTRGRQGRSAGHRHRLPAASSGPQHQRPRHRAGSPRRDPVGERTRVEEGSRGPSAPTSANTAAARQRRCMTNSMPWRSA